ncbi:MAG: hypothetical protein NT157_03370 [Candidatus Micrarchaeota archaeon]|nr:hypothetical protein [Candidatus Micrarchaeota archaeon]
MAGLIDHTIQTFELNIKWILFFSIPSLLAFLVPLFSPAPSYVSLGGTFLRTGSIPAMSELDAALAIISFLLSMFLVSIAIVAINMIIKSRRTMTKVSREMVGGLERYTLGVFWLFLTAEILLLVVNLIAYEYAVQEVVGPLVALFISTCIFYAPAAMVIDDLRPVRAIEASLTQIRRRFDYFVLWLAIAILALSALDVLFILIKGFFPYSRYAVLVINSLVVMPFLIILQTHSYISKYSILK